MVLSSEEDYGCDNVGVIGNELSVKVHKAKEGADSFDRGWGCQSLMAEGFAGSM